jgi:hypothetical protein
MMGGVRIARGAGASVLTAVQWVPRPIDEVFPFFADARNLERLTPPFLRFRIVGMSAPEIGAGTLIDYRLRIRGVPVGWRTRIARWDPPGAFVDEQVEGPYRRWRHLHEFDEALGGGTWLRDRVDFVVPAHGLLSALGRRLPDRLSPLAWIERDVRAIFEYRQRVIADLFGALPDAGRNAPGHGQPVWPSPA